MTPARAIRVAAAAACVLAVAGLGGCKRKVTQDQCDQLLDHFAELVVKERYPDAGADTVKAERDRERREAALANEFKNCTSEVQTNEFDCAMRSTTSDGLIKCLE